MARKKSDSASRPDSNQMFRSAFGIEQGENSLIDAGRTVIVLPLRPLSLQWLLHRNGFPISRLTVLAGLSGSLKTAFVTEMMNWHFDFPDAVVNYFLAEIRDTPELRRSQLGEERYNRVNQIPCDSIEKWQVLTSNTVKVFEEHFSKKDIESGPTFPLLVAVDSMTGVTSDRVIKSIEKEGHADLGFGQDAFLISSYFKMIPHKIASWPMSWVGTSHVKFDRDRYGNLQVRIPGGLAIEYNTTIILLFKTLGQISRSNENGFSMSIDTYKNSLGEKNKSLSVEFIWTYDEFGNQRSMWDWDAATITMLYRHLNKDTKYKHLGDVFNFAEYNDKARTCKIAELGHKKSVPFRQAGFELSQHTELMAKLQSYYGLHSSPVFQSGVSWRKQKQDAEQLLNDSIQKLMSEEKADNNE